MVLAWVGFFVPLIWVASPAFSFAEYALGTGPLVAGVMCLVIGLWLFYRSHADLGTNWSITLEVREQHRLVTQGVYRRIRHPMYLALALYCIGQALVILNWVAGPSNLIAFAILCALRVRAEERMMVEEFGDEYAAYWHGRSVSFLASGKPADGPKLSRYDVLGSFRFGFRPVLQRAGTTAERHKLRAGGSDGIGFMSATTTRTTW